EIRTHDTFRYDGFQDRCLKPLGHLSFAFTLLFFLDHFYPVLLGDEEEVDNLENAQRIDDEEGDEPLLLLKLGGAPESHAFPDVAPGHDEEDEEEAYPR